MGAGNVEVSQRVADVCLGALAEPLRRPGAAASRETMNNLLVGGEAGSATRPSPAVRAPGRDGMSGVHTGMTNTKNTPIEALKRAYPLRVRRLRLRSGRGAGQWRGGDGVGRDLGAHVSAMRPHVYALGTGRR